MSEEDILHDCNESELLTLAYKQGIGRLRLGLDKQTLIKLVHGEIEPGPEHLSETEGTRKLLEKFIERHWEKVRSQLPGCNGKCTSFPCSDGRHAMCFEPNKDQVMRQ